MRVRTWEVPDVFYNRADLSFTHAERFLPRWVSQASFASSSLQLGEDIANDL